MCLFLINKINEILDIPVLVETLRADLSIGPQQILSFLHIHFKWFGPGSYKFPIESPDAELTLPDREVLEISKSDKDTETGREVGQKIHDEAPEDTGKTTLKSFNFEAIFCLSPLTESQTSDG